MNHLRARIYSFAKRKSVTYISSREKKKDEELISKQKELANKEETNSATSNEAKGT